MRNPISSKLRFAITLRYLARGNSYKSFEYLSRVSRVTIENFVSQVCNAVITILKGKYLKVPCTTEAWNQISLDFQTRWQFPHALGALDGKHICIQAPSHEGSYYFNYKGFHSIVFLALVDAHYNLIFIDCGGKGRISDGGIYKNSSLYKALHNVNNPMNIPTSKSLPGRQQGIPYCIVGDDAFALSHTLMKPYPRSTNLSIKQKVFNYRLCRARRVVENAFGILCTRFRISTRPMNTNLKTTESIVMCCCALHNFLRPASLLSTENRPMPDVLPNIVHEGGNFSSNRARQIRDEFVNYFVQE
nr:unnamed protein product [Callosobruchus analis]CAI5853633.1 unnamed protein product [Callosobruchus analis]